MDGVVERKNKLTAIAGTILFHALLFLLFFYLMFQTPIPPYPDAGSPGIEINFGNLVNGSGNVEAPNIGNNENPQNTKEKNTSPTTNASENDNVLTNEAYDESIDVKKTKKKIVKNKITTPVETKEVKQIEQQPSSDLLDALNKLKNNRGGSSGGDGTSDQAGNAGSPDGTTPGRGTGNGGSGGGKGIRFDLSGRIMLKYPNIPSDSQEEGKVVVEIVVDENGNVMRATPGERGSTTTNSVLYAKARQAAFSAKFNSSHDGTKEQRGYITFVFVLD